MIIKDVNVYKALVLSIALNFYSGTTFAMFLREQKSTLPTITQTQDRVIKVHNGVKEKAVSVSVPLEVAQESVVINGMFADLGGVNAVISQDISIPLNASSKTIEEVLCSALVFPLLSPEEIKKQPLKKIIKQLHFLHSYDFPKDKMASHEEKLKDHTIINDKEAQIIDGLNGDIKKELFIYPAIKSLRKIMVDQHLNDKDRKTELLPLAEEDGYCSMINENGKIVGVPCKHISNTICSLALTPNGKGMVSGGVRTVNTDTSAHLLFWTINDDGSINSIPKLFSAEHALPDIYAVAFSSDGKYFATGGWGTNADPSSNNLMIWTFEADGNIATMPQVVSGHAGGVDAVAFHPKHKKMVSGGESEPDIFLWSFDDDGTINTIPQKLAGHSNGVKKIVFGPDGKIMISLSRGDQKNLLLWSYDDHGNVNATPQGLIGSGPCRFVDMIALSCDGKKLACGNREGVTLWDLNNLTCKKIHCFAGNLACALAFGNDGEIIMLGGPDAHQGIILYDENNDTKSIDIDCSEASYSSCFSPNDKNIITGFYEKLVSISLFKPEEEKLLTQLSQELSVTSGQLITRLCLLLEKKEKTKLSDFYQNIYNGLPIAVQKLCEGAVLKDA